MTEWQSYYGSPEGHTVHFCWDKMDRPSDKKGFERVDSSYSKWPAIMIYLRHCMKVHGYSQYKNQLLSFFSSLNVLCLKVVVRGPSCFKNKNKNKLYISIWITLYELILIFILYTYFYLFVYIFSWDQADYIIQAAKKNIIFGPKRSPDQEPKENVIFLDVTILSSFAHPIHHHEVVNKVVLNIY